MTNLKYLDIGGTLVFELSPIANLLQLRTLSLHNLKSLKTLSPLKNLHNLKKIGLYGVSQLKSLDGIENLKGIEHIEINGTSIISIDPLLNFNNLKYLDTLNTNVSKELLQKLKQKFPNGTIF